MAKRKRASSAYQLERRQYWREMISQWQQSGLSQAAFCRRHTLQTQQFSKWKLHLAKESGSAKLFRRKTSSPSSGDFIEIKPSLSRRVYEIVTPDDYRIRIEGDCRSEILSEILSVVRWSC